MTIGGIMRKIVSPVVQLSDTLLVRMHLVKPRVIIYMDGGLCSQMGMWVHGE